MKTTRVRRPRPPRPDLEPITSLERVLLAALAAAPALYVALELAGAGAVS